MLRLVGLKAENIKKLKLVDVKFGKDQHVVKISGENEQGKTSLMDSVAWALGGADKFKDVSKPIREGADRAEVVVDLEDIKVRRVWTSDTKSYLSVENKDGAEYKSPQNMLDAMVGKLAFDPAAFAGMDSKKQLEVLLALVPIGIDLKAHAADRKKVFDERTLINRDKTDLEGQLKLMTEVPADIPDEEVSTATILAEQASAQAVKESNDAKRRAVDEENEAKRQKVRDHNDLIRSKLKNAAVEVSAFENAHASTSALVESLKKQLADAESDLGMRASMLKDAKHIMNALTIEASSLADPEVMDLPGSEFLGLVDPDLTVFPAKLGKLEETNRMVRIKKKRAEIVTALDTKVKASAEKTLALEQMDNKKAEALKAAKMPIDGLTFDDEGIRYKSIPFNQCSSEEKLRVSLAMAIAMNPKLRLMFIRDGSLLDKKNRAVIESMAKEHDFLVLMEVVDEKGGPAVLVIEDGMVKEESHGG